MSRISPASFYRFVCTHRPCGECTYESEGQKTPPFFYCFTGESISCRRFPSIFATFLVRLPRPPRTPHRSVLQGSIRFGPAPVSYSRRSNSGLRLCPLCFMLATAPSFPPPILLSRWPERCRETHSPVRVFLGDVLIWPSPPVRPPTPVFP